MNQVLRITLGLTLSCLVAGSVMGGAFILTAKAKKHNEHMAVQDTMISLLGYGKQNPAPADLRLYHLYRYVIEEGGEKFLGYMIPVRDNNSIRYGLLVLTLEGNFKAFHEMDITPEGALEPAEREAALRAALKPPAAIVFADETIIANLDGRRLAYLLPGEFQGFKTFIRIMLAVDPDFKILGMEVLEHEEDPGLGGDIERDYFENQFTNKSFEKLRDLKVVKDPLPDEYRKYLEGKTGAFSKEEIQRIRESYRDQDIYALTGATISSQAVTDGVKGMARRFAYRIEVLENVVASRNLPAAF